MCPLSFLCLFSSRSEEVQETEFNSHESPVVKTMIKGPPSTQGKNLTVCLFYLLMFSVLYVVVTL